MRTIVKLILPVLASVTLAACGSSGGSSSSTQAAATSSGTHTTASSASAGVVKTATSPALHATVLVDAQGLTLYRLTGETAAKFICTSSACVQVWHPVAVSAAQTPSATVTSLSAVKRPDGTEQVAYKGEPLYTFAGDKQPGEARGQGLKDVGTWTVVKTAAAPSAEGSQGESQSAPAASGSGGSESSGAGAGAGGYGY